MYENVGLGVKTYCEVVDVRGVEGTEYKYEELDDDRYDVLVVLYAADGLLAHKYEEVPVRNELVEGRDEEDVGPDNKVVEKAGVEYK